MDAGAVAGLAVGVHRAAVPDGLQRVDAGLHDVAAPLAVKGRDHADAAGIVLLRRIVSVLQQRRVGLPGGDEVGTGFFAHSAYSAATANCWASI